jgi:outer membrane lipoprotein SlyB
MRKIIATITLTAFMLVAIPFVADAQCRRGRSRSYSSRNYATTRTYNTYYQQRPSFYRRHRNIINVGIGTGGGAIIGGLLGGRRGAGIGALVGAGSSALYTYKLVPKKRRYYRAY